jgi:glucokinase
MYPKVPLRGIRGLNLYIMKAIVLDLGGTRLKLGIISGGNIIGETVLPSYSGNGLLPRLPDVEVAINELLQSTNTEAAELTGVGVSIPGIVDTKNMTVLSINQKFSDVVGFDFNQWSQKNWGIPTVLENDARAALIGEWQYGAGKNCDNIVLVTLGTGIGGAAMIEGKLLHGKHFQAGCLGGHFTVNLHGRKCTCGNTGCVESEASSWILPELFKTHSDFASSKAKGEALLDFELLFCLASQNDKVAIEIVQNCLDAWSAGIITMIHAYDPEMVIIGGGVMKSADVILPYIQQKVTERAWTPWGKVEILGAHFTDEAGQLGMAHLLQ